MYQIGFLFVLEENVKIKKVRVNRMYINAVDINIYNRVMDINFTACKIPVSYTHLDVYKRQVE